MSDLAPLLQGFFHRQADAPAPGQPAHDRRLPRHLHPPVRLRRTAHRPPPAQLSVADLDAPTIGAFLQHLQTVRGNSATTRNARLAAIRSFFGYAAHRAPEHAAVIQRVLGIPPKRFDRAIVSFLTAAETDALVAAPDRATWTGRRDHALLLTGAHTGLRVGEPTGLKLCDVHLGAGPHLRSHGKGRKDRATPLTTATVQVLRTWIRERGATGSDPLFPTRRGTPLSRDAVERLVTKHATTAALTCPSLASKHLTPHTLAALRSDGPAPRRHEHQGTRTGPHHAAGQPTRALHRPRHPAGLPPDALNLECSRFY